MLKDRAQITETGFRVLKGPEENAEVYYGEFTLKTGPKEIVTDKRTRYWSSVDAFEQRIEQQRIFICVQEKKDDRILNCLFFLQKYLHTLR